MSDQLSWLKNDIDYIRSKVDDVSMRLAGIEESVSSINTEFHEHTKSDANNFETLGKQIRRASFHIKDLDWKIVVIIISLALASGIGGSTLAKVVLP